MDTIATTNCSIPKDGITVPQLAGFERIEVELCDKDELHHNDLILVDHEEKLHLGRWHAGHILLGSKKVRHFKASKATEIMGRVLYAYNQTATA